MSIKNEYLLKVIEDVKKRNPGEEEFHQTVTEVLESFGIQDALVNAADRGALEWVIRARMQAACCRATGVSFDWKGEDRNAEG